MLVVEDDPVIAEGISRALAGAGFDVRIARGVTEAQLAIGRAPVDLVVLDLNLPDGDGITLCRHLRRNSNVRVLIVTARDDDLDVIAGLDAGATDYVTKPFSTGVLVARVRAQLRTDGDHDASITLGALTIDAAAHRVTADDAAVELRPREFAVLALLAREHGRVVTHQRLLNDLWAGAVDPTTRKSLETHIHTLRRKLGAVGLADRIVTVRGIGYRFDARCDA